MYDQSSNFQVKEISRLNSLGEIEKDKFVFPDATVHPSLYNQNRVKQLISTQREVGGVVQQEKKISFQTYNTNQILPSKIEENFLASGFTEVVKINSYDSFGNIREIVQVNGVPITIIWGHGGKKMVLKVEGATYSQVLSALGGSISFLGTGGKNFSATQISSLRSNAGLSGSLITHYEFGSVYGLTKIGDPNGYNATFEYGIFGRLYRQRDHDGNLIQELRYNIKN